MDKLIESLSYIVGYTGLYTASIYIMFILLSLFGITIKKIYNFFQEQNKYILVILLFLCYFCFFLRVNISKIVECLYVEKENSILVELSNFLKCLNVEKVNSILVKLNNFIVDNIIVNIIILVLSNIFILCSVVITKKISECIYACTDNNTKNVIISIVLLVLNYPVYKFCKVFLVLTICLSLLTAIQIWVKIYKEKSNNKKQEYEKKNFIKERFDNIINSEVNGSYINDLQESLKQLKAEEIYTTLNDYRIAQLIKLKYVLNKDIEERKIKFPMKTTLTFLFSGIGGLSTLVGKDKTISFISNQKENITILLSVICTYMILYLINIYSSILIQNKTIGTDYLLLLIDNVIESKKEKEIEAKEKEDETGVVTENNDTIETETIEVIKVLEIDEREGY